jgi:poly(3-hydroxybutyrate) depolymerase
MNQHTMARIASIMLLASLASACSARTLTESSGDSENFSIDFAKAKNCFKTTAPAMVMNGEPFIGDAGAGFLG